MPEDELPFGLLRKFGDVMDRAALRRVEEHELLVHGLARAVGCSTVVPKPVLQPVPKILQLPEFGKLPAEVVAEDLPIVEALAERILRDCSCQKPPVPVNVVAMFDPSKPVRLEEVPMGLVRGEHKLDNGSWVLRINSAYGPRSQKFIVIREGFHILLAAGDAKIDSRSPAAVEWLADRFAAYLLMPERWVREIYTRVCRYKQPQITMEKIFEVSQSAMRLRLKELRLLNLGG